MLLDYIVNKIKFFMVEEKVEEIRFCTELNHSNFSESMAAAINENPSNIHTPNSGEARLMMSRVIGTIEAPLIAVVYSKMWNPGRTLRISFLGNVNSTVKEKIIFYAKEWLDHINLTFDFVSGSSGDIRITTNPGGSWSYIGTDAHAISSSEPTMNYGWLTPSTSNNEYRRVVLHEFGHALGAIHEHQHPGVQIPWNVEAVYQYYARTNGWSRSQVDNNIFGRYSNSQLNSSSYDPDSIMHYAIPNELTIGNWSTAWNSNLSSKDKTYMRAFYS